MVARGAALGAALALSGLHLIAGFASSLRPASLLPAQGSRKSSAACSQFRRVRGDVILHCSAGGGVEEEVSGMRLSKIQAELRDRGISYAGIFEKVRNIPRSYHTRVPASN